MQILLDTHILLWFLEDSPRLKNHCKDLIEDENNEIFIGTVSFFEIAIKVSLGKLALPSRMESLVLKTIEKDIQIIDINRYHTLEYLNIPLIEDHKDPFDRLIIALAHHEDLTVISADGNFKHYTSIINLIEA
jgi:PIN domain nuclease of toxin-antitoxin system